MVIPSPRISHPRRHSPERAEKTSQSEKTPSSSPGDESPSTPGRKHSISSSRQRSSSASSDRSSSSRRISKSSSSSSSNSHRHHRHHHHKAQGHQIIPESNLVHRSTSTSAKTRPMHDDTDAGRVIPVIQPALAIDYLGNSWKNEDDIAASWKFMTKQKNDMINGLRLENASWRNWAKQRHQLKTVSPKSLNWLKDSDTTWLYGPLYKASIDEFDLERFGTQTISALPTVITTEPQQDGSDTNLNNIDGNGLNAGTLSSNSSSTTSIPGSINSTGSSSGTATPTTPSTTTTPFLKPVLKHKTASELFKADTLFHVQSDLKLSRRIEPNNKARESAVFKEHRQPKLRFNDSVEQCISVDTDAISEEDEEDEEDEDEDEDEEDDQTEEEGLPSSQGQQRQQQPADGRLELRRYPSRRLRIRRGGSEGGGGRAYTEDEDEDGILMAISSRRPHRVPRSIVRISPTKLKAESTYRMHDEEDEESHELGYPMTSPVTGHHSAEEDDEEEGLFEQPLYLGNPYTGTELGYIPPPEQQQQLLLLQQQQQQLALNGSSLEDLLQHQEAAMAEVSYTRPLLPSAQSSLMYSYSSTLQPESTSATAVLGADTELSSSPLARSPSVDSSISSSGSSIGSRLFVEAESDDDFIPPIATAMARSDSTTRSFANTLEVVLQEGAGEESIDPSVTIASDASNTQTAAAASITRTGSATPVIPSSTIRPNPTSPPPATATEGLLAINKLALEREAAGAGRGGGGGIGKRAVDLVTNVKDLVSWASSLVRNSSTF
ncbi:hypothetical protein EMPS_11100 [Entomortierella parvispora]|uniref:Nitrogen regulatory protein areA GATA-like domain-containing protein n=1 Tax=Entomortierella parvispora TaxID=205924 RepID=A0A9P3HLE5_9FUNG|nr:hypothetical protein EMPS_11100 [Entomortierella parvispora]